MTGRWDIAASIRTDQGFLEQIEQDAELNQNDPTVTEMKRIIRDRIDQLESKIAKHASLKLPVPS